MQEKEFMADEVLVTFGMNIKKARMKKKLTKNELSQIANYDRTCLANIELGKQNIKLNTAIKLARALDVPFASLFSRNYMSPNADQEGLHGCGYIEDEHLNVFIENFKRNIKEQRKSQVAVYVETWISDAVVSRIVQGKSKNPTLITLSALAFVVNRELSTLFTRMN